MLSDIDSYFLQHTEPVKSYLHELRAMILQLHPEVTEKWQYRMPFYYYKGKRFGYLWVHKKTYQPYIGIVDGNLIDHPELIQEKRTRMKIMMLDANKDIPVKKIKSLFKTVLSLYS